jgi:uncharacterized lipoprotein
MLSACALSPQVININPEITIDEDKEQQYSKAITINVTDSRASNALGSRGGIYRDTAILSTASDMTSRLKTTLETSFSSMGYTVFNSNGANTLHIDITELSYNSGRQTTVTKVITSATVNVSCQNQAQTVNNTYRITDTKDFITTPTARQNQEAINSTLSTTLNRMFDDDNLLSCLDS